MATIENNLETTGGRWSIYKKIAFRIAFVFFLLVSIPLSSGWYKSLAAIDWLNPHYRDIYSIARYGTSVPSLFSSSGRGGAEGEEGEGAAAEGRQDRTRGARNGNGFAGPAGQRDSLRVSDGARLGRGRGNRNGAGRKRNRPDSLGRQKAERYAAAPGDDTRSFKRGDGDTTGRRGRFGRRRNRDSASFEGAEGGTRSVEGFGRRRNRDSVDFNAGEGRRRNAGVFGRRRHRDSLSQGDTAKYAGRAAYDQARPHGDFAAKRHKKKDSIRAGVKDTLSNDTSRNAAVGAGRAGRGGDRGDVANAANGPQQARSRSWLADYTSWGNALVIAVIVGLIWTLIDRKRPSYNVLYYWLTVVVRFRAAIGIIGFGFTKLFPTQMPFPSLGLLNTDFGDFTAQKIYWMSVGIVPWYQVFGGIVEVLAGLLLFFKRTATYGAILLIGALGDITFVNYSYDGGVHVYAFYFVLLGSFVVAADVPRLYNLLILERYTVPHFYYPDYSQPVYKYTRIALKGLAFLIFFVILTYTEVVNFKYDPYKQPSTAGIKTLRGNYNVTEFKINGQSIPYSPVDSVRWKEATFEKWTTLTFRVNKPVVVDPSNGGGSPMRDIQRTFEIAGTAGGQRAFHYYADTIEHVLYLQDKNAVASRGAGARGAAFGGGGAAEADKKQDDWISQAAWKNIGDENKMIDKRAWSTRRDREFARPERPSGRARMVLKYDTTDGKRVILTGINEDKDSVYIVLDKVNRQYVLPESTLSAGKY
ncbi:MAG: hypothetical protein V4594_10305 [Bacteroidota bacterium]